MDEIDIKLSELIRKIDKRAIRDYSDCLEEFCNTCQDDGLAAGKSIAYMEAMAKEAVAALLENRDEEYVKRFLVLIFEDARINKNIYNRRNSGEQDEE